MRATRAASLDRLVETAQARLDTTLALGTTTAEAKTGYALDVPGELRMLAVMARLAEDAPGRAHAVDLVPTFLGAHAVPPEYQGRADEYIDIVIESMLPAASAWYQDSPFARHKVPLVMAIACRYQGLLPAEALNACTVNAAYGVGLGERIGSIEAGKQADMLILKGADCRSLAYEFGANPVAGVIKRGQIVA